MMKRLAERMIGVLCAACMAASGAVCALPAAAVEGFDPELGVFGIHQDGKCGENVTWSLNEETGTLTISGTGDMVMSSMEILTEFVPLSGIVQSIVIGEGVTGICDSAFSNFERLTSVALPESLKRIGRYAFLTCESLEELDIPAGVEEIGAGAFALTPWLDRQKETQSMVIAGSVLICCGNEYPGEPLTEEEVRAVAGDGFSYFDGLYALSIPEGVKTISDEAFAGCYWIFSLTVPEGVERIGSSAFSGCCNIMQITLPDSLKEIGGRAFVSVNIPDDFDFPPYLTLLGENAFYGTEWAAHKQETEPFVLINNFLIAHGTEQTGAVTIPDGVEYIGHLAFCQCEEITSVYIPDSVKSIGEGAFAGCTNLTSVRFPAGLERVESNAFYNCPKLAELDLPDTVKVIGEDAFFGCSSLTAVDLPDALEDIGAQAFSLCSSLTEVTFPDSLKNIGTAAFSQNGLLSVELPEGLESLGQNAFYENPQLIAASIPETLAEIGAGVFDGTPWQAALESTDPFVIINDILMRSGTAAKGDVVIPDGITEIADYAFENCTELRSVQFPESLTRIGESAFEKTGLTELVIPPNVTEIGLGAFMFCENLTSITLPVDLRRIGTEAFYGCVNLETVIIPAEVEEIADNAFDSCSSLTLAGEAGSYAESYAKAHRIPFRAIGAKQVIGDVNCSGGVDVADAVLLARFCTEDSTAVITDQGKQNADVNGSGNIEPDDVTAILRKIAKLE